MELIFIFEKTQEFSLLPSPFDLLKHVRSVAVDWR
jgi:hypothetical protein